MPAGYTASALLGTWPTNGSSQWPTPYQANRQIWFPKVNALNITSTVPTSYTSVSISTVVPVNAKTIGGTIGNPNSITCAAALAGDSNGTGELVFSSLNEIPNLDSFYGANAFSNLPLITPQTFYYKSTGAGNPVRVDISSFTI